MATRYYTEEAYEQIKQTIEQIDNTDVSPVKDFFSDLFLRIGAFLKIYSVEQYQDDMQTWYTKVLDSHNSTISAVDSIFNAVDTVDFEYRDIMDGAVESIVSFRSTLNTLRDVISGKTSLADGKAAADRYLAAGKNSLNSAYDTILTKMEQATLWNASKELFGDALKLGAGFLDLLIPTTPAKYGVKCKKFLDTFTATLCDLGAVGSIILLPPVAVATKKVCSWFGMEISYDNYLDTRFDQLMQAQDYKDTNSVSDWLGGISEDLTEDLGKCPKDNPYYPVVEAIAKVSQVISKGTQVADVAVDLYDIGSDLKDVHDNIDEWVNGKTFTEKEYIKAFDELKDDKILDFFEGEDGWIVKVKVSPGEVVNKVVSNWIGIPASGWNNPSKFDGNVLKTAGTLWSYGEKLLPDSVTGQSNIGELPEVFFNKFKDTKFLKDVFDFARDLDDLVTPDSPAVADSTSMGGGISGNSFGIGNGPMAGRSEMGNRGELI